MAVFARWSFAWVLVLGCGESVVAINARFPDASEAPALIVVREGPEEIQARAFDLETSGDVWRLPEGSESEPSQIHALLYDQPLRRLGLSEGPLQRSTGDGPSVPLGRPELVRTFEAKLDLKRSALDWVSVQAPPLSVQRFMAQRADPGCAEFGQPPFDESVAADLRFVLPLDDRTGLVGLSNNELYAVDARGLRLLNNPALGPIARAVRIQDQIWYTNFSGELFVGRPDDVEGISAPVRVGGYEPGGQLRGLSGGMTDAGVELVALSSRTQRLVRINGETGRFTELERYPDLSGFIGVAWVGPQDAYVWTRGQTEVRRYVGQQVLLESLPSADGTSEVSLVGDLGPLLGTVSGTFLRQEANNSWGALAEQSYGFFVLDMEPFEEGFVFLLASGAVGQFISGFGFCPDLGALAFLNWGRVLSLGDDLLVVGEYLDETRMVYLPRAR